MSVPSGETLYSFRSQYPDVLARGRTNTLVGTLEYNGTKPTISAATCQLYDKSGNAISGLTMSLADNTLTVTVPAASLPDTLALGEGYREVWTFTINSIPYQYERTAALARIQLSPAITKSDVTRRLPSIERTLGASLTVQSFMDQAWEKLIRQLLKAGHLSYLIRTPDALRECHLLLTLTLACEAAAFGSDNAQYAEAATRYRGQWEKEWASVNWQTDYDNDGKVDNAASRQASRGGVLHTWGVVNGTLPRGF